MINKDEGKNMLPKTEMTREKIELLVRSALLENATNVNERLAALTAEINVDDDSVWVTLDEDLWPESNEPKEAEALAKILGIEIEWEITSGTFPFAWPGLGELTSSTTDYFQMVLDAHAGRQIDR